MKLLHLNEELNSMPYHGRGIIIGRSGDGGKAAIAYFIMGRSENSRNRVFVEEGNRIRAKAFDESKVTDPSLILYPPVMSLGNKTIVTNGDQTETIVHGMDQQLTFEQSLRVRDFEPDAPNYTPRISSVVRLIGDDGDFSYAFSLIKTNEGNPDSVLRFSYAYNSPVKGEGHFIHTYRDETLASFEGEPKRVAIEGSLDEFTQTIWNNLNKDNKVSLFTRFIDAKTGKFDSRIVNKNT